jgi:membrane protein implicated in regulation of membrane protease activity
MSLDSVPGLDLSTGTFTLPLWAVGVAAAVFVALAMIAVMRSGMTEFGGLVFRVAIVTVALVFGWTYFNRSAERDRADERRALDQRAAELVGRAIVPGSAIACLEATNTETVEGACERAVFASPETAAAATAYMASRLALLADASDYTSRRDQSYESAIAGLRRTVAADRYGLASQVLATRDGCTAETCDAFSLVYDDKRLRANLRDRLFDVTVARYATNWPTRTRPLASNSPSVLSPAPTAVNPPGPNVSFPSSQSIPPVSIMNAEPPPAPPAPSPAQSTAQQDDGTPRPPTNSAPASASRRPPAKSTAKSAPTAQAPMSLNPTKQ